MNVEIRTEAAQFPEKECINRIFVAVHFIFFFWGGGLDLHKCMISFVYNQEKYTMLLVVSREPYYPFFVKNVIGFAKMCT